MKKKILLSTLALSMAFSTMAALPFASESVSGKLGFVQKAEASTASQMVTHLETRLAAIYEQVKKDGQYENVQASIYQIKEDNEKETAILLISEKLKNLGKEDLNKNVYGLVKSAALIGLGQTEEIENFRPGGTHFNTLKTIDSSITYTDVEEFGNLVFKELINEARITTLAGSVSSGSLKEALKSYTEEVMTAVLTQDNVVVALLNEANVTASDITDIYQALIGSDQSALYEATMKAIVAAALKVELQAVDSYNMNAAGAYLALEMIHTDQYSKQISEVLYNNAGAINGKVVWTMEDNDTLTVDNAGKMTVKNNPASGTYEGKVTAKVNIGSEEIVIVDSQSITVKYTSSSSSSSTSSSDSESSTTAKLTGLPDYPKLNQELNVNLTELRAELAKAESETTKADVLAKMQKLFNEYMVAAGTLYANEYVIDKEDVAFLHLTQDHLHEMMKEVDKQFKAAIETFKAASDELKVPKLTISLDMGNTKSNSFDIKLNNGLMGEMADYSIEQVRVLSKGFVTRLNVSHMQSDIAWTIKPKAVKNARASAAMSGLSNVPVVASNIYDVQFTSPTTWDADSVFVNVPLNPDFKWPKHSLQVASIVNNTATNFTANNGEYEYELTQADTSVAITGREVQFKDIERVEAWAGAQIGFAASIGIIDGVGNNQFDPDVTTTRAELAKMMVQAFELASANQSGEIQDVSSTAWYSEFIETVVEAGLMNVYTDGNFLPNENMTRAEVSAVAARAMQKLYGWEDVTNVDEVLSVFKDADQIHPSLRKDVALAVQHNLVIGDNGYFNAKNDITRAQVAVIIYRMLNN